MNERRFDATGRYEIKGRGVIFTGPSPFDFDDWQVFTKTPWVISHPEAKSCLYRVTGVERYALDHISRGMPIGLLVDECDE